MTQQNKLTYYLVFFAFLYIFSVIIGILNNYSPVPYYDMWDAYLRWYTELQNSDWYIWLSQHNEHRIFLSRILFWIDIRFFEGASYFLLLCNFFLMLAIAYTFYIYINGLLDKSSDTKKWLVLTIGIITFSWVQNENITWGFQSQFFLAYLVPLLSFYYLARHVQTNQNKFFFLSILFGVLSVLTMGNGIAALPLLIILGLVLKLSKRKLLILLIITFLTLYMYFLNYFTIPHHGSLSETLLHHTKDFFLHILTYLGGPFSKVFGNSKLFITQFFGLLFIIGSFYFTVLAFKRKEHVLVFALLIFIAYIGATAFGIAGARSIFGLHQALSSRYMTPTLMGWSALLILFVYFNHEKPKIFKYIKVLFFMIPLLFLYQQSKALKYHSNAKQKLSALALELSVNDEIFTNNIYPNYEVLKSNAKKPIIENLSIFGNDLICDVSLKINQNYINNSKHGLIGSLNEIQDVGKENKYYRIKGWLFDPDSKKIPEKAFVVDETNKIIGYLLTGFKQTNIANMIDKKAKYSGFYGYVLKEYQGDSLNIVSEEFNKKIKLKFPTPPFYYDKHFDKSDIQTIPLNEQIIFTTFEKNKVYDYKKIDNFEIYGSFIDGDSSKGSIKIDLRESNKILYKTGPNTYGQIMNIFENESKIYSTNLNPSKEWSAIVFQKDTKTITIEIVDNSSEWGEWSAIAIRSQNESK